MHDGCMNPSSFCMQYLVTSFATILSIHVWGQWKKKSFDFALIKWFLFPFPAKNQEGLYIYFLS